MCINNQQGLINAYAKPTLHICPHWSCLIQVAVAEQDFATARALLAAGRDMVAVVDRDSAHLSAQVRDGFVRIVRHVTTW